MWKCRKPPNKVNRLLSVNSEGSDEVKEGDVYESILVKDYEELYEILNWTRTYNPLSIEYHNLEE